MDCSLSESFYSLNEDIAAEQAANNPEGVIGVGGLGSDVAALPTSYLPSYPSSDPNEVKRFKFYIYFSHNIIYSGNCWNTAKRKKKQE